MAGRTVDFKVVGLSFLDTYPENAFAAQRALENLQAEAIRRGEDPPRGLPCSLIRNEDNAVDPNAIQVHVPQLGRRLSWLGHVPAHLASRMAPSMDRGDEWEAVIDIVLVKPEHPNRPGVSVIAECVSRVPQ